MKRTRPCCLRTGIWTIVFVLLWMIPATAGQPGSVAEANRGIAAPRSAAAAAETREALGKLVRERGLSVRALIAFDRMPASALAPLTGLRSRGIDVLGASPEELAGILDSRGATLGAAERLALEQVVSIMEETRKEAVASVQESASGQGGGSASSEPERFSRPAPLPLPPMTIPSALPMVELGSSQYAGMITTAKEATRTLMGAMSEEQAGRFEKKWAAYYDFPSQEILDHFRTATPILSEFLNIREAMATTSAAFDQAWTEAQFAAGYDSEEGADAALAQADMLKDYLVALETRANMLAGALQDLGEAPDPIIAKEAARTRHKGAVEVVESLFNETLPLEGVWYGAVEHDEDGWIEDIRGVPLLFMVYATGDPEAPTYRGLYLDAVEDEDKEDPYIAVFGMNDGDSPDMPGLLHAFGENSLRHTFEVRDEEDVFVISISARRLEEGATSLEYPPPVALDTVEAAYAKLRRKQEVERAEFEAAVSGPAETPEDALKQVAERVGTGVVLSLSEEAALSQLHDVRRHNKWTPLFVQAARQWLRERPFSPKTTLAQDRQKFSAMFARVLGPRPDTPKQMVAAAKPAKSDEDAAPDRSAQEEEAAAVAEAERAARLERIEFHNQNMRIIERNLERDRAELARETDPDRRARLEFRIVGAMSDLQNQKDLVASIRTGKVVRNRTAFDDYAHAGFIANIRQTQRRMEQFQRSCDAAFKLAAMLSGSEGRQARAFVERQLSPEIRLNMDQGSVKRIAEALSKKVEGHYLGLQAESDEEAAYATLGLEAAQNIKSAADKSMMVLSVFGGQQVDAVYQAATGYIEGGPTEAVLRTAAMFGPTAGAAAEAMRGYREGGMKEALKRGAVSFAISKGLEYGMGRVLGKPKGDTGSASKPGAGHGPDLDMPASKSVSRAGGKSSKVTGRLPRSADQRALAQFKKARKQGEDLVQDFRQAQKRLSEAGSRGAPAEEIMALQARVRDKVAAVNGNPHAKNFLKYKGDALSQRSYNAHLRAVHADVEARFHANMQNRGWNRQALKEFRNSSSAGSVGMDFDIGLDEQMARNLSRDGKPGKLHEWQSDAQKAWNEAYEASTGRSAGQAWETVTSSGHAESYRDLAWLSESKTRVSKAWGEQAADVSRYKSWHMQNDPGLSRMEALQEISRGAAKDMKTKLNPLLDSIKPTGKSVSRFQNARTHWNKVRKVLADFGENNIDPVTADRRIRQLTGGKSIPEVVEDMTYLLEGAVKFGKRS